MAKTSKKTAAVATALAVGLLCTAVITHLNGPARVEEDDSVDQRLDDLKDMVSARVSAAKGQPEVDRAIRDIRAEISSIQDDVLETANRLDEGRIAEENYAVEPCLDWDLSNGQERIEGNAQNQLAFHGNRAHARFDGDDLVLDGRDAWAQTQANTILCKGKASILDRSFEVFVKLNSYTDVVALFGLDSYYNPSNQAYSHRFFDGVEFNEAGTRRFEIGHEYNRAEGSHAGKAETSTSDYRHVVLVKSRTDSSITLYVDGQAYSKVPTAHTQALENNAFKVLLGYRHANCNHPNCRFSGRIRIARLYDHALSTIEVTKLYLRATGQDDSSVSRSCLEWDFRRGMQELEGVSAQNNLVAAGNQGNVRIDNGELVVGGRDSWVQTQGNAVLCRGQGSLADRAFEVYVKLDNYQEVMALFGLDMRYAPNGAYSHLFFDGVEFNEARTRRFEIGHEYNRAEGSHAGTPEGDTPADRASYRHVVLVKSRSAQTITLYVDGEVYAHVNTGHTQTLVSNQFKVLLGYRHANCNSPDCKFRGRFRYARLYDFALSTDEVLALYYSREE